MVISIQAQQHVVYVIYDISLLAHNDNNSHADLTTPCTLIGSQDANIFTLQGGLQKAGALLERVEAILRQEEGHVQFERNTCTQEPVLEEDQRALKSQKDSRRTRNSTHHNLPVLPPHLRVIYRRSDRTLTAQWSTSAADASLSGTARWGDEKVNDIH